DVRMVECRNRARFPFEALVHLGAGGDRRLNDLERDEPIEASVAGLVDLAHSACAERAHDFVRPEPGSWCEAHLTGFFNDCTKFPTTVIDREAATSARSGDWTNRKRSAFRSMLNVSPPGPSPRAMGKSCTGIEGWKVPPLNVQSTDRNAP